ncbi:hypothetical protein [Microbulbifer halophilus]|uniref:Lipoprotein n=1 Tax=Microbulbifer halophilus TaxID=453963 RepID=A0ABW5EJI2_9GAMM|nr:hypothetical protein [Microbulbifer halophilus]MCW8128568.1 hypothetical protein [Microbulbifer halophilus]
MKKYTLTACALLLSGCVSVPSSVVYNDKTVGTYSTAAGCNTLHLEQDCSQMKGATRDIRINAIDLRIAGSQDGRTVFVMSQPKFLPDEEALKAGSKAIEDLLKNSDLDILNTRVMYGSGRVFGVHYTLSGDGYSQLKQLSVTE